MRSIIKSKPASVSAWELGKDTPMEQKLIRDGRIIRHTADRYELFSQEARGTTGQLARSGDYFKVDSSGFPYPNSRAFFDANHEWIGGDEYRQIPKALQAWCLGDPVDDVILFLQTHKGLQIQPDQPDVCFSAPLWNTILTAKADAVLVIYQITYDGKGRIRDVSFNFVARDEFEKTYRFL